MGEMADYCIDSQMWPEDSYWPNREEETKVQKTILTCDRCNKVTQELFEVGAGRREYRSSYAYTGGNSYVVRQVVAEWCLDCCIETGIATKNKDFPFVKPEEAKQTLEDLVRKIVKEELEEGKNG